MKPNYGYPDKCTDCKKDKNCNQYDFNLIVNKPFVNYGEGPKIMIIGQDPTIRVDSDKIEYPLMLNGKPRKTLKKWLVNEVKINVDVRNIYATNVIKCTFSGNKPSQLSRNAHRFLESYFSNCSKYIYNEINNFKPEYVLTLGEPAHKLFITVLTDYPQDKFEMADAFNGIFEVVQLNNKGHKFKYSPCLHISTFRIAMNYGNKVNNFMKTIKKLF